MLGSLDAKFRRELFTAYKSGYVFGMHLNFDRSLDREVAEQDAADIGDYAQDLPHRRYARLWLEPGYDEAVKDSSAARSKALKAGATLGEDVPARYDEALVRPDVESPEIPSTEQSLAKTRNAGSVRIQTMYAHFYWLAYLLRNAEKVRFFMDQESAFALRVLPRSARKSRLVAAKPCMCDWARR